MSFENFICKGVRFASKFHSEDRLKFVENEFEVYDDDVYNVTYPKSGTNWMIEILNLIKYNGDPTISQTVPVYERSPWIEIPDSAAQLDKLTRPRIISSHLPYNFFPKSFSTSKAKVIYTMRNPKDIIVSLFHFLKMHCYFEENDDFQQSIDDFLEGNVMLYGSWFDHLKGWMQMKDESRFFLNTYEELLKDHRGSVARLCKFLGKDLSDAQIDSVVKHSSFNTMKDNKMSNFTEMSSEILDQTKGSFLRKGVSGDWKNHFTVAQSEYFDRVYREKMKDLNMPFYWEQE
ncbi:sulfotransferase 2B1-like [Hyperolius riggenbachi]|uniref:sulfotransferase 2B1-like n=1 Tax=Hyperolius riggenbachi TaxID=752182 RepID=UPI0035A2AF01